MGADINVFSLAGEVFFFFILLDLTTALQVPSDSLSVSVA